MGQIRVALIRVCRGYRGRGGKHSPAHLIMRIIRSTTIAVGSQEFTLLIPDWLAECSGSIILHFWGGYG